MGPSTSLRERSKARRRAAIQQAAMRLFTDQGYEATTIAEIAEQAEVSPRTVSMYFPSKIDIALSVPTELANHLTATFNDHPDLAFSDVVDRWLTRLEESLDPELARMTAAMLTANPDLSAASTIHVAEAGEAGGAALIAEIGLPADHPFVKIVGAAVGAAIIEYFTGGGIAEVEDGHDAFVRYLRVIIAGARPR